MKKILTAIALISLTYSANSQGLEVGVKGGYSTTWLMNKNVFDQDESLDPTASFGGNFGINATYFFSETFGVGIELNRQNINQKYSGSGGAGIDYEGKDMLHYTQIPILIKLQNEGGIYFEVGPEFMFLGNATEDFSMDPSSTADYTGRDIKSGFNTSTIGLLFGFGVNINLTDNLFLNTGLRFGVSFGDITKEYDSAADLYDSQTNDALYIASSAAHQDQSGDFKYKKTTMATGGIMLGLAYKFGSK